MSTNPFRQIRVQQQQQGQVVPSYSYPYPEAKDAETNLLLDTAADHPYSDRHVSFASPPVDSTFSPTSYPSSPESARSPSWQPAQPLTPNYRAAFSYDPFDRLDRDRDEDRIIQEAVQNARNVNAAAGIRDQESKFSEDVVKESLSRFAPKAPEPTHHFQTRPGTAVDEPAVPKQPLDVDAFARLLLTGDRALVDSGAQQNIESLEKSSHSIQALDRNNSVIAVDEFPKVPPPAPAPRRAKSIKARNLTSSGPVTTEENSQLGMSLRKPPAPPSARRGGQAGHTDNERSLDPANSVAELNLSPPPPPPVRRQLSNLQRRPSNDLTPTIEESEQETHLSDLSRRSSADRPSILPSRNSSQSVKRQSLGLVNPPAVPPPRRGRDSSRSSMDSFRPSLSSITGEENDYESTISDQPLSRPTAKDYRTLPNADNILNDLANLQKEVDAARRNA